MRSSCHGQDIVVSPDQTNLDLQLAAPGQISTAPWSSWRDQPLYTQTGALVTDRSVRPEQYGDFLIGVFEEWVRRDVGHVYVHVRFACHGGCPKDRFLHTPDGEPGLNYLCAGFKRFFHHIDAPMRTMAGLLHQRRAPAEIMRLYQERDRRLATAFASAGRNDLCPCGSGKKFKQCHGRR